MARMASSTRWLGLVALGGAIAGVGLATAVAAPAGVRGAVRVAYREVGVTRVLALPTGRVTRSFGFTIYADYADLVILDAPRWAVVDVRAMPANRMQIVGVTTRAGRSVCHVRAARAICLQGLEWCGLVQGRWRATVRKTSQAAARVRVRLVFVRRVASRSQ